MEIGEYLRTRGWRLLILLVLPLVAALGTYSIVHKTPQKYDGIVQVAVPDLYANSDSQIGLYIADFGQALTDTSLQAAVHKETGVSTDDLASLSATRVNLSSSLEVDLTSTLSQRATKDAVVAAAKKVRFTLANKGLDVQQAAVTKAQRALDAAQQALTDYQNSIGNLFPSDSYNSAESSIRSLQNSRVQAAATGNTALANALAGQITSLQTQLKTLAPQVRQSQILTNDINSTTLTLRTAQQSLANRQDLATTADNPEGLTSISSVPESRTLALVEYLTVAVVVAFLLALALLLLPYAIGRWRSRPRRTTQPAAVARSYPVEPAQDQPLEATESGRPVAGAGPISGRSR